MAFLAPDETGLTRVVSLLPKNFGVQSLAGPKGEWKIPR